MAEQSPNRKPESNRLYTITIERDPEDNDSLITKVHFHGTSTGADTIEALTAACRSLLDATMDIGQRLGISPDNVLNLIVNEPEEDSDERASDIQRQDEGEGTGEA